MFKADKKFVFLFFGRLVQSVLAILSIRLLTGLLSQQEVGYQYLINSIILWFSLVLINPVGMYVNRHLHEWKESGQLYVYFKQLNIYFGTIAVLSVPIVFLTRHYLGMGNFLPAFDIVCFICFYIYFSTWFQTIVSMFNLFDLQKSFVGLSILSQASGLVISTILVNFHAANAISWMSGLLLGQIVTLFVAVRLFRRIFPVNEFNRRVPERATLFSRSTLNFCVPVAVTTLFMWFMNQGYRMVIEINLGAEILASIGVGLGIAASLAGVVESVTTQYFFPGYYADLPNSTIEKRKVAWDGLWKKTIIVYVAFCFLVLSVSDLVVRVLTAKVFHHVVPFVCVGAFIEMFRQLSNIAYLVSHAEKKTHNTILPYMVGGLFLLGMLILLIAKNGLSIESILVSLLGAGLLTYIYNLFVVSKLIRHRFDYLLVGKVVLFSLPLLLPYFYLDGTQDFVLEVGIATLSGVWFLVTVYYLLKNEITQVRQDSLISRI